MIADLSDVHTKSKRGRPFERGNQFGKGRPKGSPNKKSLLLQRMLLDRGGRILSKVMDLAEEGDRTAMALCMDRLIPRLKDVAELGVEKSQEGPQKIVVEFVDSNDNPVEVGRSAEAGSPKLVAAGDDPTGAGKNLKTWKEESSRAVSAPKDDVGWEKEKLKSIEDQKSIQRARGPKPRFGAWS